MFKRFLFCTIFKNLIFLALKMLPKYHALLGFIFSAIVFLIFPQIKLIGALIIFLSSFLIDVDHYLYYIIIKKDFSLKNAYNYHLDIRNNNKKGKIRLFHTAEFLIVLLILSFFYKPLLFVFIGFIFHLLFDVIDEYHRKKIKLADFSMYFYMKN